jgi:uncharacterized protein YndB with AHSA1/START domain
MVLKDSVRINAPPEHVWPYLEDPERMRLWNTNIKEVGSISWGQRCQGFRYRLTYVLGGKESEASAEIEAYEAPVKLVFRLTGGRLPPTAYAQEIYELSPVPGGSILTQTIRVHNSRINVVFRLLIALLHRFGKPTGKKFLVRLKELVEASA